MVGTAATNVAWTGSGIAAAILTGAAIIIMMIAYYKGFVRDRAFEALFLTGVAGVVGAFGFLVSDDPHLAGYVLPLFCAGLAAMFVAPLMHACMNWPQRSRQHTDEESDSD